MDHPEPPVTETNEPPSRRSRRRPRQQRPFWVELPFLLLAALTIAVLIKSFLIQPFYIPSGSMIPTIEINDRVLVSKLSYRFGEPQRGDIVVFRSPFAGDLHESIPEAVVRHVLEALGIRTGGADDLIKRVIGLGGEQISIHDNHVYIDGKRLSEPYLPPGTEMGDEPPFRIPVGDVFVMGDNRAHSSDSRRFGPIPVSTIVGKAVLRIWPLRRFGLMH